MILYCTNKKYKLLLKNVKDIESAETAILNYLEKYFPDIFAGILQKTEMCSDIDIYSAKVTRSGRKEIIFILYKRNSDEITVKDK